MKRKYVLITVLSNDPMAVQIGYTPISHCINIMSN